ncbi:MAG: very short patch repair endonuclease [Bacteroidota bacterium]
MDNGSVACRLHNMPDPLPSEKRSALMASVRTVGTAPELRVRKLAHQLGLRYRIAPRVLPGKPDLSFPGARMAVFVHGCFWHGHEECRKGTLPTSNIDFWATKIAANQLRDRVVEVQLATQGWQTIVIWECETRNALTVIERLAPIIVHYLGHDRLACALAATPPLVGGH